MGRKQKWVEYDARVATLAKKKLPPAFIQEPVVGLWSVQVLIRREQWRYGWFYRLRHDPPEYYAPFYNGWPGDHRGWMRFESKESARDFYKFATNKISFEEYCSLPHAPSSDVLIDLDENGDFVTGDDFTFGSLSETPQ